jgi:hypothetical protein
MLLQQRYFALLGGYPMNKFTSLSLAGALVANSLSAAPAAAQANRTWVSGKGTDSGTCTRALPCLTFAFALTQTAAKGEISVLDPGDFGQVTITQAISIVNDGVGEAGIQALSGNAITINAGTTDSVHLRGLTIEGLGTGSVGIVFNMGGNLAIENCVVRNFTLAGIAIVPSTSSSFSVSNTIASTNASGIVIEPSGTAVGTGVLSNVAADHNTAYGIFMDGEFETAGGSLNVTIVDSEASGNTGPGFTVQSASASAATPVLLRNVAASNNGFGLSAGANATLRVAHSVVTGNTTGVTTVNGGILDSYGDNDIDGNTNNNYGVLTVILTH